MINVEKAMPYMLFDGKITLKRKKEAGIKIILLKIYVGRQSISKCETNKNHPRIEMIIDLSYIFNINLDELLRSDEELEEKVIKNSRERFTRFYFSLFSLFNENCTRSFS